MPPTAIVITVSDRSASGARPDATGPVAVAALRAAGWECPDPVIIPDGADSVASALRAAIDAGSTLVVTSGGTGVGSRDATPEGTARVIEREIPGIAEELRRIGAAVKPAGMLSRGLAGISGGTLIVNLAGSPGAVADGLPVVISIAGHVVDQIAGGDHS